MVTRQIRWNMFTGIGDQDKTRYRYTFAIVNEPREIDIITERIITQMAVVDEFSVACDYPIPSSGGLHCRIFSFSSERGRIESTRKIYDSPQQFKKDGRLKERSEGEMISYIERLVGMS